jgi:hypothetical protein
VGFYVMDGGMGLGDSAVIILHASTPRRPSVPASLHAVSSLFAIKNLKHSPCLALWTFPARLVKRSIRARSLYGMNEMVAFESVERIFIKFRIVIEVKKVRLSP